MNVTAAEVTYCFTVNGGGDVTEDSPCEHVTPNKVEFVISKLLCRIYDAHCERPYVPLNDCAMTSFSFSFKLGRVQWVGCKHRQSGTYTVTAASGTGDHC